ncbi:MAG: site-specific DNA-methyltransferase [Phycisphaeraceae bacterium]|nr:site-specific DNA-methyltransferase [Phycisphaeraceae bacterium]
MSRAKTRLELTWIGKDERPKLEPRILLEDPALSYHAKERRSKDDLFDNRLIFGDNLLALKALEAEFAGKIKCIYIDPPYNIDAAQGHYHDNLEHSQWLSLMRDRFELLRRLLSDDGSMWVTLDDGEAHYCKVLLDEVFGRTCFVTSVVWRTSDNSNNNAKTFSLDHNYLLVYGKRPDWTPEFLDDPAKRGHFKNPDNDPRGPWFDGNPVNNPALRPNLQFDLIGPNGDVIKSPPNGWRWSKETIEEKMAAGEIRFSPDGKRLIRRTYLRDMVGLPPSSVWVDVDETGHNRQAKYELKGLFPDVPVTSLFRTPKPERLLKRVIELASNPGDWVLDSFAGSGTTGAVAHKMGRRWIMVELGEHCHTHIIPRMRKVIDGEDKGGVTEATGWQGGGGFRYSRLAPSLLKKDKWGQWVINPEYNPEMLAAALCKVEGFRYEPSTTVFWQQGQSSESDFIYVTTQTLTKDMLRHLSDEVGDRRSLLVLCRAFKAKIGKGEFPNLTVKKIPRAILSKCEWDRDDYSLEVKALPPATPEPAPDAIQPKPSTRGKERKAIRRKVAAAAQGEKQPELFREEGGK